MIFGAFGTIVFIPLASPESITFDDKTSYAKMNVVNGPPQLQWIYDDLTALKMDIYLHQLWCFPLGVIQELQAMRLNHVPQPLILSTENRGNFVIQEIVEEDIWRADDSTIIAARLRLDMVAWGGALPQLASPILQPNVQLGLTVGLPGLSATLTPPSIGISPGNAYLTVPLVQVTGLY